VQSPPGPPIGLQLSQAARLLSRAFDDALTTAGGSLPLWLVLLNLKTRTVASQKDLAEAIGITEGTLTHHLNAMDGAGLLTRRRDRANRRIQVIELTADGEAAFLRLRDTAVAFDKRLRAGIPDADIAQLAGLLERLVANVGGDYDAAPCATPAGVAPEPGSQHSPDEAPGLEEPEP
jgi:MarR family transcriptional regulator, transcriptional regulator for hemolysin